MELGSKKATETKKKKKLKISIFLREPTYFLSKMIKVVNGDQNGQIGQNNQNGQNGQK